MTKLRIDLKNGFMEVEGEEAFVKEVYNDQKEMVSRLLMDQTSAVTPSDDLVADKTKSTPVRSVSKKTRTHLKRRESHSVVSELNLKPQGKVSFRDFFNEKQPGPGTEMNAVSVYYLSKILDLKSITPDHVYTCYKDAAKKVPTAFVQSLQDTARLKGWIDTTDALNIKITTAGENLVEHDMQAKKSTK